MPDYDDAAQRHWDDANHLLDANRMPTKRLPGKPTIVWCRRVWMG
jgi:hypothetical protein